MDLQGVLAGVCALSCVCVGLIAVIAVIALRFVGGPFISALWDTVSGFLGGGNADDGETEVRRVETRRSLGTGDVLRTKAQSLDFDDALRRQGGVIQNQAAAVPSRTSTAGQTGIRQTGTFQAQNAPLQQNIRQTGTFQNALLQQPPAGGYTAQNAPLQQQGGFTAQNAPLQQRNMPQPPTFPTTPTGQTQPPRPNFTPLNPGLARRPTLSQGRSLPQNPPPVTPGQAAYRGALEGEELPGLRGRRQRRGEEDVYDEEANNDDILSNFGGLL
jgi:hypothetical protein